MGARGSVDRATDSGSVGRGFKSLRARLINTWEMTSSLTGDTRSRFLTYVQLGTWNNKIANTLRQ